jgi:IS1 family transposase
MNVLPFEKQTQVIAAITEGCSIRSTERLTGVNRNTIMSLGLRVGEGCERLHDRLMRDLQVNLIELDEQWDFVAKKQRHVQDGDPASYGDAWVFIALASTQKAVLSYRVGKRTTENTEALAMDLRARILNRPQITSDGYAPYVGAVEAAFGWDVDYAMLTKKYVGDTNRPDAAHRYSPGHVSGVDRVVIRGLPDSEKISTAYVERFNLSSRMQMRRFTRLTNGFSKKLESHAAAVAPWVAFYNLCRVHETRRCTPAMALGVTDHIWTIAELPQAALAPSDISPLPPPVQPTTVRLGHTPFRPRVIQGGKMSKPRS